MPWKCPECGKELKAKGFHMTVHEREKEEIVDKEEIPVIEEEIETIECICIDYKITRECVTHGELMICPYCQADSSIIYEEYSDPCTQPKCTICGKVWSVNMIEPSIVWVS